MASKYNEYNIAKILEVLAAGHTDKSAYTAARVSKSQFYKWLRTYPDFKEAVQEAKNNAHIAITNRLLELIKKGSPGATIFWLKTRFPDEWRDKSEMIHSGSIGTYEDRIQRLQQRRAEREAKKNGILQQPDPGAGKADPTSGY